MFKIFFKKRIKKNKKIKNIFFSIFVFMILSFGIYSFYVIASSSFVEKDNNILKSLEKHIDLPNTLPNKILKIRDSEELKNLKGIYENVAENDYLIFYEEIIYVYDFENDKIKKVYKIKK